MLLVVLKFPYYASIMFDALELYYAQKYAGIICQGLIGNYRPPACLGNESEDGKQELNLEWLYFRLLTYPDERLGTWLSAYVHPVCSL